MRFFGKRGSVTVEAALVLPIFISAIISIAFFIKVVYVHETVQYAINQAADQMAASGYIYYISGIQDIHDTVREGIKSKSSLFEEHFGTIMDSYNSLKSFSDETQIDSGKAADLMKDAEENFKSITEAAGAVAENPLEELKSIVAVIAGGAFDDIGTEVCTPLARLYIKKYLETGKVTDIDRRLKDLNVVNGLNGLDLSQSSFFEDENNDIDIIVSYELDIPVPFKILPRLNMRQRATAKAWLGGDKKPVQSQAEEDSIWLLKNFQRGTKIRQVFGANLPGSFPVIASFNTKTGTATMIKSLDLTADSYQSVKTLESTVNGYVESLAGYKGQEKPWGSKAIAIKQSDIRKKELILVVPKDSVALQINSVLEGCVRTAAAKGITLRIERYGYKKKPEVQGQ